MNLTEELDSLEERWEHTPPLDFLLWKKMGILREMAQRIEALERCEHSDPLPTIVEYATKQDLELLLKAITLNTELIAANTEMVRANTEMVNANAESLATVLDVLITLQEPAPDSEGD